ncbi:MAG: hypothetical protein V7K69_08545 [Nostoc sp.]|uniref:hypothetical protein n=1 Tax=Nostoc sp. TaxID=1180 RepID=UPI002FF91952
MLRSVVIGEKGHIISGGLDKRIKIWNYLSNQLSKTFETLNNVGYLAINLKANYLAAGIDYSDKVIIWNLKTFKQITEISGERFWEFELLAFNDTGERRLLSQSELIFLTLVITALQSMNFYFTD